MFREIDPVNDIPARQNDAANIRLLRARQELFYRAKIVFIIQLVLTVLLPVIAAIVGLMVEAARPAVAVFSLVVTLLDVTVLDRTQRRHIRSAAKVAECFDCSVLDLPWNALSAGKAPDAELIEEAATSWSRHDTDADLVDWYPAEVGQTDIARARLLCHRSNLWYDATLRRFNGSLVLLIAWAIPLSLALACWLTNVPFQQIAIVLTPAAPVLVWSVREHFRQKDAAESQEQTKGEVEAILARIDAGDVEPGEASALARDVQNALYSRRASNPLTIPGLYGLRRAALELQMKAAVADRLR
ncbi:MULTISPECIES: S-4TM family putative pore-forming effector [unclassified Caulobacter]|uniref:S-4TM family putative pore-forming effector n=1 Tax=unclassified Caulobacter TaxID=2648921 RepID=UPI0011B7A49D|nr:MULTISPECIES: S-4TM family putative pore-forming effector [unclassified Caulobacter]